MIYNYYLKMVLVIIIRKDDIPDNTNILIDYVSSVHLKYVIINDYHTNYSMLYTNIFRTYPDDHILLIDSMMIPNVIDNTLFLKYINISNIDILYFNKIRDQCENH